MKITIKYSTKSEIDVVKNTVESLGFLNSHGYFARLPQGINNTHSIRELVKKEFEANQIKYILTGEEIKKYWRIHKKDVEAFFDLLNYDIPDTIDIYLTAYGPGGSYYLPDKVEIMLDNVKYSYFEVLIHEIVHLILEKPVIEKYNLNHQKKENLIDFLLTHEKLKKIFPRSKFNEKYQQPKKTVLNRIMWK